MKLISQIRRNYFTAPVKNFNSKYLEDDYEILGFLGQGSTSRVFLGSNILTNQKVVIKIFKQIPEDKIQREIRVNNKINSYCEQNHQLNFPILQLLDVVKNKGSGVYAFIFQYFPGSPMHMTPVSIIK
jgi:serine/threonine protein kinase